MPEIDAKVETILAERLTALIRKFLVEFETYRVTPNRELINHHSHHELKMKDSLINIEPPIEFARYYWFAQLHKILGSVCSLPR